MRYFLVFYVGTTDKGQLIGQTSATSTNGYLNKRQMTEQIVDLVDTIRDVVITNIIELTKR